MFQNVSADDPFERCGFLIGREQRDRTIIVRRIIEVPNQSSSPSSEFQITKRQLQSVRRRYRLSGCVLAVWHTHPYPYGPSPSAEDLVGASGALADLRHVVYHPQTKTVTWFDLDGSYDTYQED